MFEPDPPPQPSLEEALATLNRYAEVFLEGRSPWPSDRAGAQSGHVEEARPAMVFVDADGAIRSLDRDAELLLGRSSRDAAGTSATAIFGKTPTGREPILVRFLVGESGEEKSIWMIRSDVELGDVPYTILSLYEQDPIGGRRSELRYRHLVEQIPAVVFTAQLDGGLYDIYVSPQVENLLGYTQAQWVANPVLWYERLHVEDRRKLDAEFARGCAAGGAFRADCRFINRNGNIVWVHGEARLIKDRRGLPLLVQGVAFDITDTKRAEEVARASLHEKETLLKEIHHRVKNNLQVTSSLLKLQAERIDDESARRALREGQNRIRSMALVHELLYRSDDLANVDLGAYIERLSRQLLRSHGVEGSKVKVERKLMSVPLPIDVAVPCGLILNELASNALKHAFADGRRGTITIELRWADDGDVLVVRDDGVGLPPEFDLAKSTTLGLRLIQTLADQIHATLVVRSSSGTEIEVRIPRAQETTR